MINLKSITLSVLICISNAWIILGNSSKTIAESFCSSAMNTKVEFETSSYWISIECQAHNLLYIGSHKDSQDKVEIPARYNPQTDTYVAQNGLTIYQINFLSLNVSNSFREIIAEPVLNVYTNSKTTDLDFFNPNRKVA